VTELRESSAGASQRMVGIEHVTDNRATFVDSLDAFYLGD
jgi:hypothetical protein